MADSTDWAARAEASLLDAALPHVRSLGWTSRLVKRAAADAGLDPAEAELLLPQGAKDLAALFSYRRDEQALSSLSGLDVSSLKMRERIARGVEAWIRAGFGDEVALRRWMGFLSLPQNLALATRLTWESADRIWRWAGDAATDENHYSKRAILAALLTSTLAVRLSGSPADADRHLQRGIDAVMGFERFKSRFAGKDFASSAAGWLGRLRYGAHPPPREEPAAPDPSIPA
jgi:ubiquinone biosynthesis protein COQ9